MLQLFEIHSFSYFSQKDSCLNNNVKYSDYQKPEAQNTAPNTWLCFSSQHVDTVINICPNYRLTTSHQENLMCWRERWVSHHQNEERQMSRVFIPNSATRMLPLTSWMDDSRLITATSLDWRDLGLHVNGAHGRELQHAESWIICSLKREK